MVLNLLRQHHHESRQIYVLVTYERKILRKKEREREKEKGRQTRDRGLIQLTTNPITLLLLKTRTNSL